MKTSKLLVASAVLGTLGLGMISPVLAERGPGGGERAMFLFDQLDADKDGKVTEAEIEASRTARVTAADSNGDGLMSADELAAMQLAEMSERAKARATEMIARMDSDGDGLLSAAEMAAGPGQGKMFDRIDADGDGAITREEADAAAKKMAERGGDRKRKHGDDASEN
jgi:Ca2+-binding EF-hand superfamily protein